jgi:hypothetical protein
MFSFSAAIWRLKINNFVQGIKEKDFNNELMTAGLVTSCNRKLTLYKNDLTNPWKQNKDKYIKYRNKLKALLRKSERLYYNEQFNAAAGNAKETWNILNAVLNKKHDVSDLYTIFKSDSNCRDLSSISNRFNEYFVSIGKSLASGIDKSTVSYSNFLNKLSSPKDSFVFYDTNETEIFNIVCDLKSKASTGHDGLSVKLIKPIICYITKPLCAIFNNVFSSGIFPQSLKIAKVIPVFKTGCKINISNYRPISILPCFSKILEKLMYNRLIYFLTLHNLLNRQQYGFRKKHSTLMALLDIYDVISNAIENKEISIGIFLDLSKAFDTINHSILVKKLEHYGVRGIALNLLANYLKQWQQYVSISNECSTLCNINGGVPQGSILDPLLFLIYVNDIVNCCTILKFILFADDTNIFISGHNILDVIRIANAELMKLSIWFKANQLFLNVKNQTS